MLATGFQVFMLYAGLNGALLLALALWVARLRAVTRTPVGDGGRPEILRAVRAHGNAAEFMPIVLVLMLALAAANAPAWQIHAIGAALTLGRVLHAAGLMQTTGDSAGRTIGFLFTLASLLGASVLCILRSVTV